MCKYEHKDKPKISKIEPEFLQQKTVIISILNSLDALDIIFCCFYFGLADSKNSQGIPEFVSPNKWDDTTSVESRRHQQYNWFGLAAFLSYSEGEMSECYLSLCRLVGGRENTAFSKYKFRGKSVMS